MRHFLNYAETIDYPYGYDPQEEHTAARNALAMRSFQMMAVADTNNDAAGSLRHQTPPSSRICLHGMQLLAGQGAAKLDVTRVGMDQRTSRVSAFSELVWS